MTPTGSPRKEFVLVVDRDYHRGRELTSRLRDLGCYATFLGWAEDALRYVAEHIPDVIVADSETLGMTCEDLIRRAKMQSFATKVILLSDHADWRLLRETLRSGGDDLLSRPVSTDRLLTTITRSPVGACLPA